MQPGKKKSLPLPEMRHYGWSKGEGREVKAEREAGEFLFDFDMIDLSDNSLESALEPLDGLGLVDTVGSTDLGLASSALSDTLTRAGPN